MMNDVDHETTHPNVNDLFPQKETEEEVRHRLNICFKWLDKCVALMRTKEPHEVDLSIWVNEDHTVACPASWCGMDPEFHEESFVLKVPSTYQPKPVIEMPTFIVRGHEQIGAAAISEMFELYTVTNGNVPFYHVFGYFGESMYDIMIDDDNDRDRFIQRVGFYKKDVEFAFEELFGSPLLTKD